MSGVDEILNALPLDQLASNLASDPQSIAQAAQVALPAILGGLQANAQDPAGANSLLDALTQHSPDLLDGGVDLAAVDASDGERAAAHIFGSNQDQVIQQLGNTGVSSVLLKKLIPILVPIVLSYVMKKLSQQAGGSAGSGGASDITFPGETPAAGGGAAPAGGNDVLGGLLGQVLSGALGGGGSSAGGAGAAGNIIGDLLGGLLGGGRR